MAHPAKANLHMVKALIEYVSTPGQVILDPMSGTGSIMVAATVGRKVMCIEIEQLFFDLISIGKGMIQKQFPEADITLLHGSCLDFLPMPGAADHIIFSPPYAQIMQKKKVSAKDVSQFMYNTTGLTTYSLSPNNLGTKNEFFYSMDMEKVYAGCYQTLKPGGTMTVIIKDHMRNGQRVYFSDWVMRVCMRLGFDITDWFKWDAPGTGYQQIHKSHGVEVVEDEDLMVFTKKEAPHA